jgi:DNA-binding NtrC family response regulator
MEAFPVVDIIVGRYMRILIIDDHLEHGEALTELLTARGHEAYFAPSSFDADWLFDLFQFDLSLVDFDMPETNGAEVARRLLERSPRSEAAIMSAHRPGQIAPEALGGLPFFPKPIVVEALLEFLDQVLLRKSGAPLVVRERYPLQRIDREAE